MQPALGSVEAVNEEDSANKGFERVFNEGFMAQVVIVTRVTQRWLSNAIVKVVQEAKSGESWAGAHGVANLGHDVWCSAWQMLVNGVVDDDFNDCVANGFEANMIHRQCRPSAGRS